jgi:NADPH:quinone reductase-like Zn-dependent oxidoreductase
VLVEPCIWEAQGQPLASPWFLGSECDGGFAEYTRVAARHAHPVDSSLSDIELASFPCSYSTAENMLMRANVQSDDTVLVTGASGGVGSAAVQLAKAYGARTIAVTGAAKRERLVELGADATVDRSANIVRELGANSVDVIVDAVAGPTLPSLFELLRPGGRYAVSGAIAGPMIELDVRTLYLKDLSFFGCTVLDIGIFDRLIDRIESGQIRPIIAATYPLREIGEAQIEFQAKTHVGKIVLDVAESRP